LLPYINFKVTILEFAYKSDRQFERVDADGSEKEHSDDLDLHTFVDTFALKPRKLKL